MSDGLELLDHQIIGERYFFPRPDRVEDAEVVSTGDVELRCYRRRVARDPGTGSAPLLLHFHGNGEVVADWASELAPALESSGIETFMAEYRGYGGSSGFPVLGSMLDDALAVADVAGDPARIVVYGRSVGSIYALDVAANRPVAGLIIESGIAEVGERFEVRLEASELGATDEELSAAIAEHLDHKSKLEAFDGPVLILHAENDHLVDIDNARDLAAWAGDRGELVTFDQGDHNSIWACNGPEILERVTRFVKTCAGG